MNDQKKICPLRAIIKGHDDDKSVCSEGRCVWWDGKSCKMTPGQPAPWRQHPVKKEATP